MTDEVLINRLYDIVDEITRIGGEQERTSIVPGILVTDANPSDLPTGYIKIVNPRDGTYVPCLTISGLIVSDNDLVNVLFTKGTEPIALSQSANSPSNTLKVSEVWESDFDAVALQADADGNIGISTASPAAKLEIDVATASDIGLIIRTTDDSTVNNFQEWQASTGVKWALIDSRGNIRTGLGVTSGHLSVGAQAPNLNFGVLIDRSIAAPSASVAGVSGEMGISGATTITNFSGLSFGPKAAHTSGTVTNMFGVRSASRQTSTGTVTNAYAFFGVSISNTGGGTQTNAYGLYLEDITSASVINSAITTNAGNVIFNEGGDADTDVRIEGNTDQNLFFTNAGLNAVGIGTNSPDAKLDVLDTAGAQLRLTHTDASKFADFTLDTNHDLTVTPSSTGQIIFQPTADSTDFFQVLDADGGTPVLNVDSTNERVGIGIATPGDNLAIVPTAVGQGLTIRETDDGNDAVTLESNTVRGAIKVMSGGATVILFNGAAADSYIDTGGDFGLGTTNPSTRLDIDDGAIEFAEMTAPAAGAANTARDYAEDDGSGNTRRRIKFSSGNAVTIAVDGGLATYTPSNVVTDRSYDADATSVAELADVLGTLIADFQAAGVLG